MYIGRKVNPLRLSDGTNVLGLRQDTEVNPCHGVEIVQQCPREEHEGSEKCRTIAGAELPIGYNRIHNFSSSWLAPGQSVGSVCRATHLAQRLGIYVSFNFEWESHKGTTRTGEPQHRAYFRASQLPENISGN